MDQDIKLAVSVLLLQEEGKWVAQCLEYDVAAQAETLDGVKQAFMKALASQACANLHAGKEAMEDVPRAPQFYHDMANKAMKVREPELPTLPMMDVEVRELAIA